MYTPPDLFVFLYKILPVEAGNACHGIINCSSVIPRPLTFSSCGRDTRLGTAPQYLTLARVFILEL